MRSLLGLLFLGLPVGGITIKVDYSLDTSGFFENPDARVAIEAAAARWSRVVDQTLLPVDIKDDAMVDGRFQLIHPATGETTVYSAAGSSSSDLFVRFGQLPADVYLGEFSLDEDVWILYVGARNLSEAARGGPIGDGGNVTSVYNDPKSFLNRGFNKGRLTLAPIGGVIAFDSDRAWNFDLTDPSLSSGLDLYTIAIHEIGHGLGLNSRTVSEWSNLVEGDVYVGENAVAAYNADNGTNLQGLAIESASPLDYHWRDNEYDAKIFPFGRPLYIGTVGPGNLQDLLMEGSFSLSSGTSRFEITNVEVAALRDIGWSIIEGDPERGPALPIEAKASSTGGMALSIPSKRGATYTIQTSPDGSNWLDVIPSITGDGNTLNWSDSDEGFSDPLGPATSRAAKYYRVIKN